MLRQHVCVKSIGYDLLHDIVVRAQLFPPYVHEVGSPCPSPKPIGGSGENIFLEVISCLDRTLGAKTGGGMFVAIVCQKEQGMKIPRAISKVGSHGCGKVVG